MTRDDLGFEARELFRNARDALGPSPEDLARLHARVRTAIAGGATAGVLAMAKTGSAAAGGAVTTKLVLVTVAGSMLTWWAVARHRDHRDAARGLVPPKPRVAQIVQVAPVPVAPPAAAPELPAAIVPATPVPAPAVHEHVVRHVAPPPAAQPPPPAPPPAPAAAPDTLEAELAVVRSAEDAMTAHDPARALAIVRGAHVTQLAAELAAIEIDALCALDQRDLARARGAAFLARWPHAALRDRVMRSCARGGVR